jgi:glycosyltransferase involved in cell wall biosynthesis
LRLTIGMPSYNNMTEVWFTIQSLRLHHNLTDCEILVVDNFGDPVLEKFIKNNGGGVVRYEKYTDTVGTSCTKNKVFELARGEMVLCMDSHVLIRAGALDNIPVTDDLIHGPIIYTDNKNYCCEWLDQWRGQMWGIWGKNVQVLPKQPFEIWGMGTGFFVTKRTSWLGYNKKFRGFGGEQGYLHEKYRKAGRKVWCYPNLVWMHMFFDQGRKIPYPCRLVDRVRNYLIGFEELGKDPKPIIDHYGEKMIADARAIIG